MIKKILFFIFVVFFLYAKGQNNGATIHVFQANQQQNIIETKSHRDSMKVVEKNCITWNWSLLTRGIFLLNYERYLSNHFVLDIGVGITYRDFLFEYTKTIDSIQQFQSSDNSSLYGTPSPNFCGEVGLRYYVKGYDNMEGLYIEPTLSYRAYSFPNSTYTPIMGSNSITPGYNFLDEQFKIGYISSRWFSDFITEIYMGFSIRNATINGYEVYDNNYGSYVQVYKPVTVKETYPQFLFGFKVGYPL